MNYSYEQLNSKPNVFIPTGDLRVSPYEIEQLHEVEIRQKINEHSTLYLRGLLKNTPGEDDAELLTEGTNIALSAVDATGEEYMLYQGLVKEVAVKNARGTRYIEIKAVSYSYIFDIESRSRSFQDKRKTYNSLIKQVAAPYDGAKVTDSATNGAATGKFIMQHEETDWDFLKRMASRFNTGLFCDIRYDKPSFVFGLPDYPEIKLDNTNYTIKKDMHRFSQLSQNGVQGISENDYIGYEVKTNCVAMVGNAVTFRGKQLYVSEIVSTANRELFVSHLVLMPEKGLSQPYISNIGVVGASYGGHILNVRNDLVKVALNTDAGHDPGTPYWFPYSTIYSSKSGSGWYCMPEKGDSIRVYFPDGDDDHAYAISSVHEGVNDEDAEKRSGGGARSSGGAGGYSGKRDNPDVKSLTFGDKEIRLTPEGVYIITGNSMITMTEEGVVLMTENDIEFKSDKSIILNAEDDVNIIGTAGVELKCAETASISINENVESIGQEVLAN